MNGWVKSFEVEKDGEHVLMTCHDPDEGQDVIVRVAKQALAYMADAQPFAGYAGLSQTPTDFARPLEGQSPAEERGHCDGRHPS